jgi:Domain of unknown function (DUF4365)
MADDFGPLPEGDRQDTLQQLSLKSLRNALPEDKFLFRDERADDKGVDGTLEAKVAVSLPAADGSVKAKTLFTNCRAQAQLKSTDQEKANKNGSISYSVDTSNFNYLLNGTSPIYLLWIAPTNEIRYAWARDELQRLDVETPDWKAQQTIALRFRSVLTPQAVDEVHARILQEARLTRRITETLARSALAERVTVQIYPRTLESTDPARLHEWLTSSGMTVVSAGYGRQAIEWIQGLNSDQRSGARVQLVAAYAHASLGRNFEALGHLSAAALKIGELADTDRQFVEYLRDACEYYTGRMDLPEYLRRERAWADRQSGAAAMEHRLEVLRQERLRETDRGRRAQLFSELQDVVGHLQDASDASAAQKLQARIMLMAARGDETGAQFVTNFALLRARHDMGHRVDSDAARLERNTTEGWEEWARDSQKIIADATAEKHPLLIADALAARVTTVLGFFLSQRMDAAANGRAWERPEATLYALMADAERAMQIYAKAGNIEEEVRARLLLADLFESVGQESAAKSGAEAALPVARAMGYSRLEAHARDHLEGQTVQRQFERLVAERQAVDEDVHLANETDEALRSIAEFSLEAAHLPPERLPVVEREWQALRLIARERVRFCRHLQLLQNLTHTRSPDTHYRTDPPRGCLCERYGYKSGAEHTDPASVIAEFKANRCNGCPSREPKGTGPATPAA